MLARHDCTAAAGFDPAARACASARMRHGSFAGAVRIGIGQRAAGWVSLA